MSPSTLDPNVPYEKPWYEKAMIVAVVAIPLVATLYAIVLLWGRYVSALDLALLLVMYFLTGFGVTIGFHRLLTHRSFETNPIIKTALLILGSMALEGSPIQWASTHIEHHANSDTDEDPHSPLAGLWHAHIGWSMNYHQNLDKYGSWLLKDPLVVWVDRWWVLWVVLGLAIPAAIAGVVGFLESGWTGLVWGAVAGFLWGGLVRVFLVHHTTWSVNSICHTFGTRPFATKDASRNNFLIGLLALGEGWHNNHHAFPRSAFHGLAWWQIDPSAYFIRLLEATGLAWNVQRVTAADERKRQRVTAD